MRKSLDEVLGQHGEGKEHFSFHFDEAAKLFVEYFIAVGHGVNNFPPKVVFPAEANLEVTIAVFFLEVEASYFSPELLLEHSDAEFNFIMTNFGRLFDLFCHFSQILESLCKV
jgi:hypothetical protein